MATAPARPGVVEPVDPRVVSTDNARVEVIGGRRVDPAVARLDRVDRLLVAWCAEVDEVAS